MDTQPKEKARELIDKMSFETHKYNAKHCALTAVDEIINEFDHSALGDKDYEAYKMEYWQEVKQEIENFIK